MTKEEYQSKLKSIEFEFETARHNLYKEFALSNAKFKLGDMIRDSRFAFVVDRITVSRLFDFPEPVYHGYELRKDLTPRKYKSRVAIYGNKAELINI